MSIWTKTSFRNTPYSLGKRKLQFEGWLEEI
jgi:hypothetical protein